MLLVAFSHQASAAQCDPFAVAVATDPAPYQYPRGLEKARALLANVPDRADIILIGDSLLANWPADMAQRQFKSDHVWNFAVNGAVSQNTLWQIHALGVKKLSPRTLVVLVGTNNLTREDMPACAVAAGIRAVVSVAHRKWPAARMHVMGIPPRGTDFHFRDGARLEVNRGIENWARDLPYLQYFDVDTKEITCGLYDQPQRTGLTEKRKASPCANYADDFGHFKRAGYEVIFRTLMRD
jgi:lysophospholipase L1-like esterase